MKIKNIYRIVLCTLLVSACGGGGNSSGAPTKEANLVSNIAPKVAITGGTQLDAGSTLKIVAEATDNDGSIASYLWELEPGSAVVLGDADKATASLTAADVDKDTAINVAVTVTDNAGASTKSSTTLKVIAKKTSITLSGLVTNGAAVNAALTITAGDLGFSGQTDATGNYIVKLDVDRAHLNNPVLITAIDQSKPTVKLMSQLPSVSILSKQAGIDQLLDANENFGVNVTALSTAKYGLMLQRWRYYGVQTAPVSSDQQLQIVSENFARFSLFKLAALIKIAADTTIQLPPTATTSFDLALDSNLALAFEQTISAQDAGLIQKTLGLIEQDSKINNQKKLAYTGDYIFYSSSTNFNYLVNFSSLTHGTVKSALGTNGFAWSATDNWLDLTLDQPLPFNLGNINRITFTTYDEIGGLKKGVGSLFYNTQYTNEGAVWDYEVDDGIQGGLLPVSSAFVPEKNELIGNWILGSINNAQNLQLNTDGSASLSAPDGTNVLNNLTWALAANSVQISQASAPILNIYLISHTWGGYQYVSVNLKSPTLISTDEGSLIKSQNIALNKSNLVGTYATTYGPAMITSDGMYSDQFSATGTSILNFISDQNSWDFFSYQQDGFNWITNCDLTTNKACKLLKRWNNKVVAASDNGFYILRTEKTYALDGISINNTVFSLFSMSKLPQISFFSDWFTNNSERHFYQQTSAGIKVWLFNSHALSIGDKAYYTSSLDQKFSEYKLTQGKLHYERDGSARVLELISVSENGLNVCEYNEGASCNKSSEFLLSNRAPVGVSFSVEGQGSIEYIVNSPSIYGTDIIFYDPDRIFGNATAFAIKADSGYAITSVSGCGGVLNGSIYKTAIIKDKCTISAVFSKTGLQ